MNKYKLYLDESGVASINNKLRNSPFFILSGLIVEPNNSERIKNHSDRIKFKYWGDKYHQIVFHSREIGRRDGDFIILRDPNIEKQFYADFYNFLYSIPIRCIVISVDKNEAAKQGYDEKKIYDSADNKLLELFITFLYKKKASGKIIIESAGSKSDFLFYKRYSYFLANGCPALGITHQEMKNILTSISFVSKRNFDIETQIADVLAYPALLRNPANNKIIIPGSYEEKICSIFDYKLISINGAKSHLFIP
ncbi:MAG: DUF3800 domain-containing protein [Patescibacteria group bacterium]|jgi:hypothetical protein